MSKTLVIFLAGVAGSGKTTLGNALALVQGWDFIDADDFHSVESKEKMRAGHPLSDNDRWPWLRRLRDEIHSRSAGPTATTVVACSALKVEYRRFLAGSGTEYHTRWFIFKPDKNIIADRLRNRKGHFMGARMAESQLSTFEPPTDREEWLPIEMTVHELIQHILGRLTLA